MRAVPLSNKCRADGCQFPEECAHWLTCEVRKREVMYQQMYAARMCRICGTRANLHRDGWKGYCCDSEICKLTSLS